jgi:hypothetical protein
MRKRAQARRQVNHDDMWITVPSKHPAPADGVEAAATHDEAPTYEENWYQVLRRREDGPKDPQPAPEAAADVEPVEEQHGAESDIKAEPTPEPAPEPVAVAAAIPARPDAGRHASSLD